MLSREKKVLLGIFGPILVLFLALFAFQYKTYCTNKARVEAQLYKQQELVTTIASNRLQSHIREIIWKLDELGGALSGTDTPSAQAENISRMFDNLSDRVDGIAYFDADGRKVNSVSRRGAMQMLPAEGRFEEFFSRPKYTLVPYISPLMKFKEGGEGVYIAFPVRKSLSGEFRGVLLAQVNKGTFGALCASMSEQGPGMSFCYYDEQGQQICDDKRCSVTGRPWHKELLGASAASEIIDAGGSGPRGLGGKYRLFYQPVQVEGYRWYISSAMPMSAVNGLVRRELLFEAAFGTLFIISLIGGGLYFIRVYRAKFEAEAEAAYQTSLAEQGKALASEKDKLLFVLNSIPDGIMLLDKDGKVLEANAKIRDILGVSPKGRLAEDLEGMPDEFPIKALLGPVGDTDEQTIGNKTYKLVSIPVTDPGQGTLFEVRLLRDVTLERSLAQKKSDLVSMITHDVKSPLTAIIGISQWLGTEEEVARMGEDAIAGLEAISRAANRILGLMDNFLFLSSIEGARKLCKQPVDINEFINKALLEFHLQAKQKDIKLDYQMADPPPVVYMDEHQMMRAVANLISNALKYTPEGGHVSVSAKNFRNYAAITVSDTGQGVNKKDIPFIFDRYYRADSAKKAGKGSGLGLAIAKAVVELHNGTLDVETEEGHGTSFTLRLPVGNPPREE